MLPPGDSVTAGSEFSDTNGLQVRLPVNSVHNLKVGCRNGDDIEIISEGSPDKLSHNEREDGGLSVSRLNAHMLGCDAKQQLYNRGTVGRTNENAIASNTLNFALIWKKVFCNLTICLCVF